SDNAAHVVVAAGEAGEAEINGFTITRGYASLASPATVNGISVPGESGAGMIIVGGSPTLNQLKFTNNRAVSSGGALFISDGQPQVSHSAFAESRTSASGGAVALENVSLPVFDDCQFSLN